MAKFLNIEFEIEETIVNIVFADPKTNEDYANAIEEFSAPYKLAAIAGAITPPTALEVMTKIYAKSIIKKVTVKGEDVDPELWIRGNEELFSNYVVPMAESIKNFEESDAT
jgi:hypothetical protein